MFGNSFAGWVVNTGIAFVWLAIAVGSGSYFLALGAALFLAVSFLLELPSTDSAQGNADDTDDPWNWP
ncbi:MAG: hypothetical protein ABIP58_02575 [Dehalococcoidia bacterium]